MDVAALPYKIGQFVDSKWQEFKHGETYCSDDASDGELIRIGAKKPYGTLLALLDLLKEPVQIVFVFHTPKEESDCGRYLSPPLTKSNAISFLARYQSAFDRDARADVWAISQDSGERIGWEKHDFLFASSSISTLVEMLREWGFREGEVELPFPHTHHYHDEFDLDFQAMLHHFDWERSELLPGDGD